MKSFFILLLVANIALGLAQWLLPYEQLVDESPRIAVAEKLQLLDAALESEEISETTAIEKKPDEILVSENQASETLCYTIGPFKDKTRALEVSGRYAAQRIRANLKSSLEKDYLGVMVYVDGHETREQAVKTASFLASQGIREYIIVSVDEQPYALSIGVFGLKKNAERLIERLKRLNLPVKSRARYRERRIYWLYYEQPNTRELLTLLDQGDIENGISQLSSKCG